MKVRHEARTGAAEALSKRHSRDGAGEDTRPESGGTTRQGDTGTAGPFRRRTARGAPEPHALTTRRRAAGSTSDNRYLHHLRRASDGGKTAPPRPRPREWHATRIPLYT